ncbi:Cof-type HAD-IIB family hydrolase [Listeria cossartiae subsp. cayugensis]|uniref:Cof-type HAD-IIB family hydrolase n=1 Tax=Listeria cossartiae TaxID=2838249 RepID=UPI0028806BD7|nr:Cof-type HAD-IIB family hydrolase [Listeria cossartiae]MDT0001126.1 Cof-type HAD-IIB family hydrolase [Listeria cossartiae subsp. cayugensis]MDT0009652.1 Cof-type HAD-IIB family hydrolase [Listeria cossartiae subsp. cayugensis]MDT0031156.1 Cof-type HAD-IIB family hydrolase [Listeria cossartiae subsp. cayugensis]MDT0039272.1 Cof-type HAD-IIB family hydrolase [Listeria cossartiae subsp. cayugensis]MDT0044949.1 Cof-type HAD-IIB family hydrolase [Listeria cossartiae subsp. cayugensis]
MIKAIAVDMDGTFLDENGEYDRGRFEQIYAELVQNGIRFIVASGNQYYQLKSFFPEKDDELFYVAENGAVIFHRGELRSVNRFEETLIQKILWTLIQEYQDLQVILCGVKSAYLLKAANPDFKAFAKKYYFELQEVDSFDVLPDDTFIKFALDVEVAKTGQIVEDLNQTFAGEIRAVSSGHGSIDIIIPGVTKGSAIQQLLNEWQVAPDDLLAFGDANNDLEMLQLTPNSYAMQESSPEVLATAKHVAPSNKEAGVLQIVEEYMKKSQRS